MDEVGWGSPAGPIVSCVVVLVDEEPGYMPAGVTDSKRLSPKKREMLFEHIIAGAADVGLGACEPWEVDEMGPFNALQESYRRALAELRCTPDLLIMDGTDGTNRCRAFAGKQIIEPKADFNHLAVAAASIVAKVVRDKVMGERAVLFKKKGLDYGWEGNCGYLTRDHLAAIERHGLLFGPEREMYQHRRSYCSKLLGRVPIYGRTE